MVHLVLGEWHVGVYKSVEGERGREGERERGLIWMREREGERERLDLDGTS